jgi:hypothetical protein
VILHEAGVKLGFGSKEEWEPRLLLSEAAWIAKNSNGLIDHVEAIKFISSNLEEMFEINGRSDEAGVEFIAFEVRRFRFVCITWSALLIVSILAEQSFRVWIPSTRNDVKWSN